MVRASTSLTIVQKTKKFLEYNEEKIYVFGYTYYSKVFEKEDSRDIE
jgi:hypothetical protein